MSDFSIEAAQERITDHRTRRYFAEVYSSYSNGNYRSAVVMLWSVAVCDLLFKLDFLVNLYADKTAKAILDDINKSRHANPKSSEWEWSLVEKVRHQTQFLDATDLVNLDFLHNHRHLSAHPVLTHAEALYSPSKEQCRAHIRNILEGVLTKPAIMSRQVLDMLLEDVEATQAHLPDDESLRRYLDGKYWRALPLQTELALTRSLWRIVFLVTDARAEANRAINYRVLRLFYERNRNEFNAAIQADPASYSQLTFNGTPLECLLRFLAQYPGVFAFLPESATTPIRNHANSTVDKFLNAWFLSGSVAEHLAAAKARVDGGQVIESAEAYRKLVDVARANALQGLACESGIVLYAKSAHFDTANHRCEYFVLPYLGDYDPQRMQMLLAAVEQNDQTYYRRLASHDHRLIRDRADQLLPDNWIAPYPNFARSV